MTKAEQVIEKIEKVAVVYAGEKKDSEKTYPISRALMTMGNVELFGYPGFIQNRARQGRVNMGTKGITESERALMSKMKKEDSGKTYPISRTLTSPGAMGAYGAAYGAGMATAGRLNPAVIGAAAVGGAALGAGGAVLNRFVSARAIEGRAAKGRTGWGSREKELLKQIKESK